MSKVIEIKPICGDVSENSKFLMGKFFRRGGCGTLLGINPTGGAASEIRSCGTLLGINPTGGAMSEIRSYSGIYPTGGGKKKNLRYSEKPTGGAVSGISINSLRIYVSLGLDCKCVTSGA